MLGVIWTVLFWVAMVRPILGTPIPNTTHTGVSRYPRLTYTCYCLVSQLIYETGPGVPMRVITIDVPHLGNRTHVVHDGRVGVVIDPPREVSVVEAVAEEAGVDIVAVAETHIHNDYVSGGLYLSKRHGAEYLVSADEDVEFARIGVHDNETLAFGNIDLRVIATPVTRRCTCRTSRPTRQPRDSSAGALFSGGSLLHGTVGRTDLIDPTLTTALARAQWLTARRLGALPTETTVHPTHGFGSFCASAPASKADGEVTIADQRDSNPALTTTRDQFVTDLLAGLGPVPSHYAHMGARNRSGPWTPRPGHRLDADGFLSALARGAEVVDVRSSRVLRSWPPARQYRDPSRSPVRGVRRLGHAVGLRARTRLRHRVGSSARGDGAGAGRPSASRESGPRCSSRPRGTSGRACGVRTGAGFADDPPAEGTVVLDVRRPEEWRAGHLPGSFNIAVHELPARLGEIPPGELWVHCAAGYRATVAAGLLDRAGRDVVLIDDEFAKIRELGIPLLRGRPAA